MSDPHARLHRIGTALALLAVCSCGGSGAPASSPSATPTPVIASGSNPCTAALAATQAASSAERPGKGHGGLGPDVRDARDLIALNRLWRGSGRVAARATGSAAVRSGDLVVLNDDGSLITGANAFDLGGLGLRFEPNALGGYDVRRAGGAFRADLGRRLTLADDDTSEQAVGFPFTFYGVARSSAFVNSDGNLTFGAGDVAIDERSLGRVLSGAPRVAPFFADLNPSSSGGVFVSSAPDAFTVTWCTVPDFDASGKVTAQATLLPGGAVEIRVDPATTLGEAVVALSPGATSAFAALDLSATGSSPSAGGPAAVGERFAARASLDLVAAARRAYGELADNYDQLLFWTDTPVTEADTFAFESTVKNQVTGIGTEIFDVAGAYGSGGRLESVVLMDDLGKYPADPNQRANGENTTLALVAHETGHRWGATLQFRDATGGSSDAWLGRQRAHWSFFCDSDASVLEGNDIEDRGGGSFRTVDAVKRYGPFDLYAMGLLAPSEVSAAFFVASPSGAGQTRESPPRTGVSFNGTRRDVTIADVVAAMGPRNPPSSSAPRVHRQAWVYVVGRGRTADAAALGKLDTIRRAFADFFAAATGARMSLETRLD